MHHASRIMNRNLTLFCHMINLGTMIYQGRSHLTISIYIASVVSYQTTGNFAEACRGATIISSARLTVEIAKKSEGTRK